MRWLRQGDTKGITLKGLLLADKKDITVKGLGAVCMGPLEAFDSAVGQGRSDTLRRQQRLREGRKLPDQY
jgi:hypothetical protein